MSVVEFNKFISLTECTREEYLKAKEYLESVKYRGTRQFLDTCFEIVKLVVEKMYKEKFFDYQEASDIYTKYGLSDDDFDYYFKLYFRKYAGKREKEKLNSFMNNTDEKIWKQAKDGLWENDKLQEIACHYEMSIKWVQAVVRRYFVEVLKYSNTDIIRYKAWFRKFKAFISSGLENNNDFGLAYEFYNTYASASEKEAFWQTSQQILKNFGEVQNNPYLFLEELHMSLYDIYMLAKLFNNELLLPIIRLFEPFYNYCSQKLWVNKEIKEEAKSKGYSVEAYKKMAEIYARVILGIDDLENKIYLDRSREKRESFGKKDVLEQMYRALREDEYFSLIENYHIVKSDIDYFCYMYNAELPKEKKEKMEKNLLEKLQSYYEKKKAQATETRVKKLIADYLGSSYTLHEYCKSNGYCESDFRDILRSNPDAYALHEERQRSLEEEKANNAMATILSIIDNIKNGITINDINYPFTLIDLFVFYPTFNYKHFSTSFLVKDEAMLIRRFINPLKYTASAKFINRGSILQHGVSKRIPTPDGDYIREFSKEEILEIFSFMDKFKIPFIDFLFSQICVKYATGKLAIYNQDDFGLK